MDFLPPKTELAYFDNDLLSVDKQNPPKLFKEKVGLSVLNWCLITVIEKYI